MGLKGGGTEEKEKEEEEKISHMCESIGHRPLRGRCPKAKSSKIFSQWCMDFRFRSKMKMATNDEGNFIALVGNHDIFHIDIT